MLGEIGLGFQAIFTPTMLAIVLAGTFLGLIAGGIPAMSGSTTVALLLPVTYKFGVIPSLAFLSSIYAAATYGGSITAVLYNIPGAAPSIMTTLDGYPMSKQGKTREALATAIFSSFTGGIIGSLLLLFFAPTLAQFAVNFAQPEYFALVLLGFSLITTVGREERIGNLVSLFLGLFLATIGMDLLDFGFRFASPSSPLSAGLDLLPIILGAFALPEVFTQAERGSAGAKLREKEKEGMSIPLLPNLDFYKRLWKNIFPTAMVGAVVGALPGAGASAGALFGYFTGRGISEKGNQFGTGIPEGISSPESANNAACVTAYIPLLAFGIPGSGTTAILLGAFILNGLNPGPMLFVNQPQVAYSVIVALLVANLLIIGLNRLYLKTYTQIIKTPMSIFMPIVAVLCVVGSLASRTLMLDLYTVLVIGLLSYGLKKSGLSTSPLVIGFLLGSIGERSLRTGLAAFSLKNFIVRPVTLVLLAGVFILPLAARYIQESEEIERPGEKDEEKVENENKEDS